MLEQLRVSSVPIRAMDGPMITGFSGPSFIVRQLSKKVRFFNNSALCVPTIFGAYKYINMQRNKRERD